MGHLKKYLSFTLSAVALFACKNLEKNEQPNVIILMTDDQGYGDFSVFGNPVVKTPNLDHLHDESIRFTDFHVAPASVPTLSQMLTWFDAYYVYINKLP
ncbi:MAG: hypothetical protein A2X05_16755 [Bacteroidetes bacterium GWE2_41_25]|nr:MAG: hypothetical protein A2X06_11680 [Bacteroidetes bacterium GWC2_40_22]OFY09894.1 MAG: hypothetical protein A2X05_16755 [Bacteroidetes bacterium GWE2_41_25]OFY57621.1 MAG: hypothetical protein A2X04_16850 [Bacteroidetes bacterium GWF2_41_9]HAM10655.1 hypothetical protein [Bacteroidales bacterium]HBH85310.1 hypothetical protein [Bacteroidales bacterium]